MNWAPNILFWHEPRETELFVNCLDHPATPVELGYTQPIMLFPETYHINPLVAVWRRTNRTRVIGVVEARLIDGVVLVEMMATHPQWRRQGVNTAMLKSIQIKLDRQLVFDNPTNAGSRFIKTWQSMYQCEPFTK